MLMCIMLQNEAKEKKYLIQTNNIVQSKTHKLKSGGFVCARDLPVGGRPGAEEAGRS